MTTGGTGHERPEQPGLADQIEHSAYDGAIEPGPEPDTSTAAEPDGPPRRGGDESTEGEPVVPA